MINPIFNSVLERYFVCMNFKNNEPIKQKNGKETVEQKG
jgi:hypothetical protein